MKTTALLTQPVKRLGSQWALPALTCIGAATLLLGTNSALGGSATWDFTTDPTLDTNPFPIKVYQSQTFAFKDSTGNSVYWKPSGGNPGGFLGVCWPIGSSSTIVVFPDIDQGKLITAFKFEADLRIGNPQQDPRAADGFSINFARSNDPVFTSAVPDSFATGGAVETGTRTGLSILFDTWSGNALPDGNDVEGIIVRVDNVTVLRQEMPTRNGSCTDTTSLQTGNRNLDYWTYWKAHGFNQDPSQTDLTQDPPISPDAAFAPDSWTNLCWAHLSVELDINSKLTVVWKGRKLLDGYQTSFFPSAGGLVLAGRTGGADEHTHFDNIVLTTTASAIDNTPPTVPGNLQVDGATGANRVALKWDASTDASGRVAYDVARDGIPLAGTLSALTYIDYPPKGGQTYTYTVRAIDVSNNKSAPATLQVTTAAEATTVGGIKLQIFRGEGNVGIGQTTIDALLGDPTYFANAPTFARQGLGGTMGSPSGNSGWNESFGDNFGLRATGVLTPSVSGNYHFFLRSDDASAFYLNTTGTAIPDAFSDVMLAHETDCCDAFQEPGTKNDDNDTSSTTATPIALTAGQSYGFMVLMKEGGGGDGVGLAWRLEGDTTPAADLQPINPIFIKASADPVGATLNIATQPTAASVMANERVTFTAAATASGPYGTNVWYAWLKNGAPIYGANGPTLVIPAAPIGDNNADIAVVVGTYGLVQTGAPVKLTVSADTKKPTIASVTQTDVNFTTLAVKFSEPVTSPTATTAGNYTLSGGATVSAATLSADGFTVTLTTSKLTASTEYTLTVNNVTDIGGNTVAAATAVQFFSWFKYLDTVNIAYFGGIGGTAVSALTSDTRYPNTPDDTFVSTNGLTIGSPNGNAGWNETFGDNYGIRATGVFYPPTTGKYYFFIRSDDASQFFLNTSGSSLPATTGTPTVKEDGCCNAFFEPGTATQTTATPISLTAGQGYGFVVLLKEGGGGDGVGVAMRIEGDKTPANTLTPISVFGPKLVVAAQPTQLTVSQAAGNITITWTGGGTLLSAPAVTGPWTAVSGAASPYTTATSGAGAFYRVQQ